MNTTILDATASDQLASAGVELVDFGPQPVSNRLLHPDASAEVPRYPVSLRLRPDSGLIHLAQPFPLEELRPRLEWLTYQEPEDHLDQLANRLMKLPGIDGSTVVAGFSYKDDTMLDRLQRRGCRHRWRIDPIQDLDITDPTAGIETCQAALTPPMSVDIARRRGTAGLLVVRHVLEHAYDLSTFMAGLVRLTEKGGYIVFEVPDCRQSLELGDFTMVWEEHVFYFTPYTLKRVLQAAGLTIVHEEIAPYALENSLVYVVRKEASSTAASTDGREEPLEQEIERAQQFARLAHARSAAVRTHLQDLRRARGPIAIFGAGHLAVAFLAITGTEELVSYVIDDNPQKRGMRMPVGGIEIVGSEVLGAGKVGVCLLGINPQNQGNVVARHQGFIERGGVMASIFPGSDHDLLSLPVIASGEGRR